MNWRKLFRIAFPSKVQDVYHVDFKDKVIPVFRFSGQQFYAFKDELDMPYGRYQYMASFIQAIDMRMTLKVLNAYIEKLEKSLSGGKGSINIGEALITIKQMKTRATILFDVDLAYSLASCVYFTDTEPLNTYSMEMNKKKIAAWREVQAIDFFMLKPVKELIGLGNISLSDLMTYLEKSQPVIQELNLAMQTAESKSPSTTSDEP